jgi:hypothetical protein
MPAAINRAAGVPRGANRRAESGVFLRAEILLLVPLLLGVPRESVAAESTGPAARPASGSAEVARSEAEPALERSDRNFLPFAGKRVRRIQVRCLEVFGPTVDDTTRVAGSRLERLLNHLNFLSRESTIRGTLLFREGDAIDPDRLAESERLLRNLPFLGEARIAVVPLAEGGDSTDVRVIVKESWTLKLSESLKQGNRLKVSLAEENLLGLGHQVSVAVTRMPKAKPRLGFDASYSVQNIRGSFVTGTLGYVKMPAQESAGLALSRELVTPLFHYAGGVELRRFSIAATDTTPAAAGNSLGLVDLWAGRPVLQWGGQKEIARRRSVFLSGRLRHLKYTRRPPQAPSGGSQFHNTSHALGSLTFIKSWYYRTNLLYNFGRTEDIPYGILARVTYGAAQEETARSRYAAATLAAGDKIGGLGYAAGELRVGGSPRGRRFEQGVIRLRTIYFSNLLHAGGFRLRQFVRADYTAGIHRSASDNINFNGEESIRGVIYNRRVFGSKRLHLDCESVAFTPWKVRGVTFAFFSFADVDVIGTGRRSLLAQSYYSGLGLGLRLHKDGLGIGPVQLRFAWYPRLPIHHAAFSFSAFAEERFRSIEFLGITPEIVEY